MCCGLIQLGKAPSRRPKREVTERAMASYTDEDRDNAGDVDRDGGDDILGGDSEEVDEHSESRDESDEEGS